MLMDEYCIVELRFNWLSISLRIEVISKSFRIFFFGLTIFVVYQSCLERDDICLSLEIGVFQWGIPQLAEYLLILCSQSHLYHRKQINTGNSKRIKFVSIVIRYCKYMDIFGEAVIDLLR